MKPPFTRAIDNKYSINDFIDVGQHENIRFVLAPKGFCDIGAQAQILDRLGVTIGDETTGYEQFFVLNSGVRGPFFRKMNPKSKTTWIDFIAMSGRSVIMNPRYQIVSSTTRLPYEPESVSVSPTINWDPKLSHQSYFISFPAKMLNPILPLYQKANNKKYVKEKMDCILGVENESGFYILNAPQVPSIPSKFYAMYSLHRDFFVRNWLSDGNVEKKMKHYQKESLPCPYGARNPMFCYVDPCAVIFHKLGGNQIRHKGVAVELMTASMKLSGDKVWNIDSHPYFFLREGIDPFEGSYYWHYFKRAVKPYPLWPGSSFEEGFRGPWIGEKHLMVKAVKWIVAKNR
jgi:hypothetical protein